MRLLTASFFIVITYILNTMDAELDKKLCEDFPVLYEQRKWNMSKTCMCWGFPGDGWEPLIREFSSTLEEYNKLNPDSPVMATQVKEKYGLLIIYLSGAKPEHRELVHKYEEKSATVCETCGRPSKLRKSGFWIRNMCDVCHA